jgi:hypothetical protein
VATNTLQRTVQAADLAQLSDEAEPPRNSSAARESTASGLQLKEAELQLRAMWMRANYRPAPHHLGQAHCRRLSHEDSIPFASPSSDRISRTPASTHLRVAALRLIAQRPLMRRTRKRTARLPSVSTQEVADLRCPQHRALCFLQFPRRDGSPTAHIPFLLPND